MAQLPTGSDHAVALSAPDSEDTRHPRWILVATISASSLAFIDGSVVKVALPAIGHNFQANAADLQWKINAYVQRLLDIGHTAPIPLRSQNGGDYNDVQVLRPEHGHAAGHALHQSRPAFVSNTWLGAEGNYTTRHIAHTSRDGADAA